MNNPLVYGSVCSGIEAATVAWHPLGWKPAFFSDIEKFPRQVLTHHYPEVPLHGDFTTIQNNQYDSINLLVGGTPCQAFSVAGLRKGLDDPRGNLTLSFLGLASRLRPKWIVWENVCGVLSIDGGRTFGAFLGGLAEIGYGFAYRVLDAQYFGVPQRRRRVFVVGYIGDYRRAAAVLFERDSLRRNSAPRREARKETARNASEGSGGYIPAVAGTLDKGVPARGAGNAVGYQDHLIAMQGTIIGRDEKSGPNGSGVDDSGSMFTLTKTDVHAVCIPINTQHALGRENGRPDWPMGIGKQEDPCFTLTKAHGHAVAFSRLDDGGDVQTDHTPTMRCGGGSGNLAIAVRRLTPTE